MSIPVMIYCAACIFAAAFVRGYSGFGFSLLAITSMSLALPPAMILPSIFMMEVAASVSLLPSIWRFVHWRDLGLLWLGCLLCTPLGVRVLAAVPAAPMKVALGVAVLGAAALLWSGYRRKTMPTPPETVLTGAVAGFLNGAFGIIIPVIVFFFNSPAGAAVGRASLIAFFIGSDAMGVAFLALEGLVTASDVYRFLMFVPALMLGQWLGARSFKGADETVFRRWALVLLAVLALVTALQGVWSMLPRHP
jgi:uncharacterized membrane protein YfcA